MYKNRAYLENSGPNWSRLGSLIRQLHDAIYRPDSFVLMPRYCTNLKAIRYESTTLKRTVADISHRVIVAYAKHVADWCCNCKA